MDYGLFLLQTPSKSKTEQFLLRRYNSQWVLAAQHLNQRSSDDNNDCIQRI